MFIERLIKTFSVLIVIFLFSYGAYLSFSIFFWQDIYQEIPVEEKTIKIINAETGEEEEIVYNKQSLKKGEPFAFLLLGTDSDSITEGRSDSIIIGVAEPRTNTLNLVSVPRDSWIPNAQTGKSDKITHAFNHGVLNTIQSLEDYFQIPITYYAVINMNGFIDMVDAIGGLDINVKKEMQFYDRITNKYVRISPGIQHMNGNETINYARFRGDAEGDFGRNKRQREVIIELAKQTVDIQNIKNINKITRVLENNFRTNVKSSSIPTLISQLDFGSNISINQIQLEGSPSRAGKMSIVSIEESERLRVTRELQQKLNLSN